jgi:hypothetical protein
MKHLSIKCHSQKFLTVGFSIHSQIICAFGRQLSHYTAVENSVRQCGEQVAIGINV